MSQLIINVENPAILPSLKKILEAIDGVSIINQKKRKTELQLAIEEARAGKITRWESSSDLINYINSL